MTKQYKNKKIKKQMAKDLMVVLESIEEDIDHFMATANRLAGAR